MILLLGLLDCPVDPDLGLDDPNNIFTCKDDETCCTTNLEPACCAEKDFSEAILEQVKLWGSLLGFILALALFVWWCRTDEPCCDVEKPCLVRFGCKKRIEDEDEDDEISIIGSSQLSLRSSKSATSTLTSTGHTADELKQSSKNFEAVIDSEDNEDESEKEADKKSVNEEKIGDKEESKDETTVDD